MGTLELQLLTDELANVYEDIEWLSKKDSYAKQFGEAYAAGARRHVVGLPVPGLFLSVALAVLTGYSRLIMAWAVGGAVGIRQSEQAAPIEVLETALTVVAVACAGCRC